MLTTACSSDTGAVRTLGCERSNGFAPTWVLARVLGSVLTVGVVIKLLTRTYLKNGFVD
ncbi:MAG: hypothetical protein AVDCRST_MAG86-964 [uncultured Truepera sp.]|uniref:Uncharacterized protein n=1 Tax=uncultured Truepera sp. TaxID=543023 RepID=A0A6J4UYF6_9DEIN|nr:MAG: hypothetical protein AVDCRST_MAG86-964 [uncultured Truepera sp.]